MKVYELKLTGNGRKNLKDLFQMRVRENETEDISAVWVLDSFKDPVIYHIRGITWRVDDVIARAHGPESDLANSLRYLHSVDIDLTQKEYK